MAAARLPEDADSAVVGAAIDEQQSALGRLQMLRDALIKAELALDASTTAASHLALQATIRDNEGREKKLAARKRSYQPWSTFFKEVCRLLQAQQAEAIGTFTTQYGPRTSNPATAAICLQLRRYRHQRTRNLDHRAGEAW